MVSIRLKMMSSAAAAGIACSYRRLARQPGESGEPLTEIGAGAASACRAGWLHAAQVDAGELRAAAELAVDLPHGRRCLAIGKEGRLLRRVHEGGEAHVLIGIRIELHVMHGHCKGARVDAPEAG